MLNSRTIAEVRAELADEHRRVMQLIARIEAPCPGRELPELLKTLHDLLVNHFAHEQFPGGLYEKLGANRPEHHDTLKSLVREHCELLSGARALVERSAAGGDHDMLRGEVDALLRALHEHETREHALARDVAGSAA